MTSTAETNIAALRAGHDRLASFVAGLSAEELTAASGASEWDISQVLSHLGSGAEIGLATLQAALAGRPSPDNDFNQGVWARWNAMSPVERAAAFGPANEAYLGAFEALDAAALADLRIKLSFLPAPIDVAGLAAMRLSEYALHAWDVRVASDPAATLAPEATPILFGWISGMFGWLAKPAALDGRQAVLRVETVEPARQFGLVLGDQALLTEDAPDPADGVLTLPAEAWLRLVAGRLSAAYTPAEVDLKAGELTLDDLRAVFPGY
jgi:uncharacterized protein (TIGR03083 family)